ncbi:flagellar basal-body rod protein FlgG [Ketobacter alkanivorans]|uniref:Flagellar basal-body rod protein FlgG n=1 Tax=Ketobacter alkanivorans TaxID=1917421 RepID=A0A2K9LKT4_9GAMM|nr:flagellar basal-body rod protein FlgG [Ketobacter alkanivorans]AUM12969.1 flagellar basal-body rod protein FlgG [Ketobacter alkanivorans]
MLDAIYIATSGMQAEQAQIDTISNNLANINTAGYKKSRVSFEDLVYQQVNNSAASLDYEQLAPMSGMGASLAAITKDFSMGDLKATQNLLDVAIQGAGFFEVDLFNGEKAYTRNGSFKIDSDGMLSTIDGRVLSSAIRIPSDASQLLIRPDGSMAAKVDGNEDLVELGQIDIANFVTPENLEPLGSGLFAATDGSGLPLYSEPGSNGTGELIQGYIETSNVDLVEEMLSLVVAQRAYEMNSQIIRASDEILKINNNLRS